MVALFEGQRCVSRKIMDGIHIVANKWVKGENIFIA